MISHLYSESYTPFSCPHFPDQTLPGDPLKASYLEYKRCHKENNCRPYSLFLYSPLKKCNRVCTQSKKLCEHILASLDREKMWAGKWCINFWVKMTKHGEISTYFRVKHHCGKEVVFKQKTIDYPPWCSKFVVCGELFLEIYFL